MEILSSVACFQESGSVPLITVTDVDSRTTTAVSSDSTSSAIEEGGVAEVTGGMPEVAEGEALEMSAEVDPNEEVDMGAETGEGDVDQSVSADVSDRCGLKPLLIKTHFAANFSCERKRKCREV